MKNKNSASAIGLTAATLLLVSLTSAQAGGPVPLSDRQLDQATAGGVFVFSNADAQALAAYRTMATTGSNTIAGTNEGVQQGFQSEGGLASGVAVSYGTNGASKNSAPPTSDTSVTTGGVADGNFTLPISGGGKVSALGLTIQSSFTSVYGVWVPGL